MSRGPEYWDVSVQLGRHARVYAASRCDCRVGVAYTVRERAD